MFCRSCATQLVDNVEYCINCGQRPLQGDRYCQACGQETVPGAEFCAKCGVRLGSGGEKGREVVLGGSGAPPLVVSAEKATRVVGYLIDVIPAIIMGLFGLIPIIGAMIVGLLLTPYWLLRDVAGASPGKLLLGLRVANKNGQPASIGARILRNLPIAIGPAFLIIPLLGMAMGPAVAFIFILIESITLLAKGERVGDMLAGTTVVRR